MVLLELNYKVERDAEPDQGGPVVHLEELEPDAAGDERL